MADELPAGDRPEVAEPWGPTQAPDAAMLRVRWGARQRGRSSRPSWRAWLRTASAKLFGRGRNPRERPRVARYRGRKGSRRLIVSSRIALFAVDLVDGLAR